MGLVLLLHGMKCRTLRKRDSLADLMSVWTAFDYATFSSPEAGGESRSADGELCDCFCVAQMRPLQDGRASAKVVPSVYLGFCLRLRHRRNRCFHQNHRDQLDCQMRSCPPIHALWSTAPTATSNPQCVFLS